ncbi:MAG: toll/interleukin-1 receptor domain-containing protein [bacterium]|nr:toll/interleukin-1 receptor domain-containing protein [bacterium]
MGKVFISYSHKDETWKDWFIEIEKALNSAQVVIMLISSHFLGSGFIKREELPRILKRRRDEGVVVIPLVLKPCAWKSVQWLADMQLRPKDGKPLSSMRGHKVDEELAALVNSIASLNKGKRGKL